jgi:hypothetical protein
MTIFDDLRGTFDRADEARMPLDFRERFSARQIGFAEKRVDFAPDLLP